jgi:ABC-2 type transport system permease protein
MMPRPGEDLKPNDAGTNEAGEFRARGNPPFPAVPRRTQLTAIAWLRWQLFVNTLRTTRGQLELLSRILVSFFFAVLAFGGGLGLAILSYMSLSSGKPLVVAVFFWMIFVFWQVFPIMATAFASTPDSSDLLRFPLSYSSYFLVRLAYGAFDPASAIGSLWTLGIVAGTTFAKPSIFPWALLVVLVFVAFNIVLSQTIFAWVERWLAQRRTREIMGVLFLVIMLGCQLIAPLTGRMGKGARPGLQRMVEAIVPIQQAFPPGLAADAIIQAIYPQILTALSSLGLLCAYTLVIAYLLHVRLAAQYRGENLSEIAAASTRAQAGDLRPGWSLPGFAAPVAAVLEKEIRYLMRSGPMLFALIMPMVMLILFRFGAMNSARRQVPFFAHTPDLAFPVATAYAILALTNLVYNNFGGDAAGIQFLYASPASFRDIVLAKNLTHAVILAFESLLAWTAVALLYRRPSFAVTIATVAGLLFAAPLNFAVGNLLSLYSPRKVDYSKFGRQRASQLPALVSIGVQFALVGIGVSAFWLASYLGNFWIATLLLLALAGVSFTIYRVILNSMDRLAVEKRETMVAELCKG